MKLLCKQTVLPALPAFLSAVLVSYLLASGLHTLFVLQGLANMGVEVSYSTYLRTIFQDLLGLLPGYGTVILLGLALGFTIIKQVIIYTRIPAKFAYPLAGALTFIAILESTHPIFEVTLIAGARTNLGYIACLLYTSDAADD